ncbi:zf-4CXXC R1 domain-containing protein [Salix suchowensis]|nr:zf-4CXXC R1 domain-containing protein [Salix suchowensis]
MKSHQTDKETEERRRTPQKENSFAAMAVSSTPADSNGKEFVEKSRTKCPGVPAVGGRIHDSQNGKNCHQCRQKTLDFAAVCTTQKGNKLCTLKFCHKCLLNRYGEKAEEVALLDDWQCPKCRGICNCSFCMKRRGHKPTGMLVRTAKENGFSSVSELLQVKGLENLNYYKDVKENNVSPKKSALSEEESTVTLPRELGNENSFEGNIDMNLHSQNLAPISSGKKSKKTKRKGAEEVGDGNIDAETRLKESAQKKTKKEGTKEGSNGSRNGEASSKARITEEVSENETKTTEKDKCDAVKDKNGDAFVEKKRSKTQPQEFSKNEVLLDRNYFGGIVCGVRNDKIQTGTKMDEDLCKVNKFPSEFQTKSKTAKERLTAEIQNKEIDVDIQLPQGTCLKAVAGIELPPEDVGNALQFLEFCASFGKVLGLKKGQADTILGEIVNGHRERRSQSYHLAQIHVQLLSVIQKDIGEESPALTATNDNSWFQALGKCVSKCLFISKEIPFDSLDLDNEGYDKLKSSEKLRLLNFLCDEALNTKELRSWIDDENSRFFERKKEAKEKVLAAKDKERLLKRKMQDEVAKAIIEQNSAPDSVSNHKELVSQIKSEAVQARADMLEARGMVQEKRPSNAVRTDPVHLDADGRAFWKLNGHSVILLQDMGAWNSVATSEKWLEYSDEQKMDIEKYISFSREKMCRVQKAIETPSIDNDETK